MAHSRIEPETSINQSPYALPTELFRLMEKTGLNLYLYIVSVFSSIRGCVIHVYYYFDETENVSINENRTNICGRLLTRARYSNQSK